VRAPLVVVGASVAAASVASSALFAGYRSMLPGVVPPHLLTSAFAVDAVLIELCFVAGPAVAGLLSLVVGAPGVLVGMAVAAVVAMVATRRLPLRPAVREEAGAARAPAPGSDPELVANYAATAAAGMMIGLFEAGFAPFAAALGYRPGLGGLLSAAYALGSGAGGLVFATRLADRQGHGRRGLVLLAVLGALIIPVAGAPSLVVLLPMLLVAGTPFATANAASSSHLQARLHAARTTEGFALSTTAILLGIAAGNGVAGVVLHTAGTPRPIYVLAGVPPLVTAAAIGIWSVRRR
jgi:predicted MFS family arabinose efflux permease